MGGGELERLVVEMAELMRQRYYGKYRGIVKEVDDEDDLGRIRALVPEVLGDVLSPWALPCVPFAGKDHGLALLPEVDDGVWIEFEAGDPARPIWTGAWWGDGDLGTLSDDKARAFITSAGHKIVIDETANKIQIEHADGAKVEMTDSSMTLECKSGKVVLDKSGVNINGGTLTVK